MLLYDSAKLALVLVLCAPPAAAESAATIDEEALITPAADCRPRSGHTWTLTREARLSEILKTLSDLTCERFFVPKALLNDKLSVDIGSDEVSPSELHQRVEGALRSRGIILDVAPASRVRRAADGKPTYVSADRLENGIKCSLTRCVLTREIADAMLADSAGLASQARIVPSFKDGKAVGFKLFAIRPGSYWSRLALQNGDTVLTLDGYDLTSPDKLLEAYARLRKKSLVKLELDRRGEKMTIEYVIK